MHAVVLLCINQHMKFEVLSFFTTSKDMIGQNFKKGYVTPITPIWG